MTKVTFETVSAMWTCDPFIDEDGTAHIRLGLYGDGGEYAAVNVTAEQAVRSSQFFLDNAARLDEAQRMLDMFVDLGKIDLHERDAMLRDVACRLMSRLHITAPSEPAAPA